MMELGFREHLIVKQETCIELFKQLNNFVNRMEEHMEQFPGYEYSIELLGGEKGSYSARIIITKYNDNNKTELIERDPGSYGIL